MLPGFFRANGVPCVRHSLFSLLHGAFPKRCSLSSGGVGTFQETSFLRANGNVFCSRARTNLLDQTKTGPCASASTLFYFFYLTALPGHQFPSYPHRSPIGAEGALAARRSKNPDP